jgi:putative ABC transport system permease protein
MRATILQDVRFAVRLLRRDRGFAATAIFVLAAGIGVNNMFFTILYAHTLRGLPIADADRIVYIATLDDRSPDRAVSYADFDAIGRSATALDAVAAFTSAPVTIAGDARAAERVDATFVSANAFELIGAAPLAGRGFVADDEREGAPAVALLANSLWRSRFGADLGVIGHPILVNGAPVTVAGIVRDASGLPATGEVWLTLAHVGLTAQPRGARTLRMLGRIRPGADLAAVRAEVGGIVDRLSRNEGAAGRNVRARVVPIDERYFGRLGDPAWRAFIAASVLVALISCANMANLMLTRAHRRAREFAIRSSLGAPRRRLVRQLIVEAMLLAAVGGAAGAAVSVIGVKVFSSAIPERTLPYWVHYSVDARVIAALVLVSLATVALFGIVPAVRASRPDVNALLKEGGRAPDRAGGRWATGFLVAEFALAVVLLGQLVISYRGGGPAVPSDRTIDTRAVVTSTLSIPSAKYATPAQRLDLVRRLETNVGAIPGVASVSLASAAPLSGGEEAPLQNAAGDTIGMVRTVVIDRGYFAALDVPLARGRDFTDADGGAEQPAAIVNERFAARFLDGRMPVGQQIVLGAPGRGAVAAPMTIVGVAADIRQASRPEAEPVVYLPYRTAAPPTVVLVVRSVIEPAALVPRLRQEVLALDAALPVYRIQTLADVVRNAQWNARLSHRLILLITFIAVALSAAGLYAVTAHGVAQRTREIGVRMALGAQPRQVLSLVVRRVLLQLSLGLAAGIVCSLAWDRMFSSGRAGLSIMDPRALAAIALTMALAAVIACVVPARRAVRLDPVAAIRGE